MFQLYRPSNSTKSSMLFPSQPLTTKTATSPLNLYFCKTCARSFKYKPNLLVHEKTHLGLYPYYCPYCNKGESATSNLKSHMRRYHTGVEGFLCNRCNMDFSHVRYLKRHLDEGCSGTMNREQNLEKNTK